jgi:zinc protease
MKSRFWFATALALVLLLGASACWGAAAATPTAPAAAAAGERFERLDNGLRVIVRERHLGGVAAFRIYISAGSLNEGQYNGAGISHLLEHVVSGGATPTRTEDQIRVALEAIGAQTNAMTSKQWVCYLGETSGANVNTLIDVIGDYVANNVIEKKAFDREFEVVQRELERAEANPDARLWKLADESFFLNHPARPPVIGYLSDLRSLRYEDAVRFYNERVTPDNAVAVAVGDFDADAVMAQIKKVLGPWKRKISPVVALPPRQAQVGPREARGEMDVTSTRMIVEFPTVQLTHPDLYALDILAFILGEGRASRLVSDLRDQKGLVDDISCASITPAGYDGGRFSVIFQSDPDKAEAARKAVLEHLARVVKEKVSADELARAKRQKVTEFVFGLQECSAIAEDLASNELLVGDRNFSERYTRNIQAVTAEDVQRVAAAYLKTEVMCTTSVAPKAEAGGGAGAVKPAAGKRPEIIAKTLDNGVRLLLCPVEGAQTVSIQMVMKGGLSVETEKDAGTSAFMAKMLMKGAGKRKAADIASILDTMGAEMSTSSGRNTVYLSARCLAEDFEKTFDLAADCLLRPTFPQEELERVREQTLADLAHMTDSPAAEAGLYFNRVFFQDSPYQFPVIGTPDIVKALSRDALLAWHKKYVVGNNLVVAVFGKIDPVKDGQRIADAVGSLPKNEAISFPRDVAVRKVPAREVYIKATEKDTAIVYVAYPGMDLYNLRDRFAMDVMDTIVSGYQMPSGWLHEELRSRGLVYEVHAFSLEGLRPGYFTAMAVCQPKSVPDVVKIIEAAMDRATRENFKEEDLQSARATVITAKELGRESLDGWAFEAAVDECLGLGIAGKGYDFPREEIDLVRRVRIEDVMRVARQYLKKPVIVILTKDPKAAEAVRNP